ncbi:leucine-rich repeat protein [Tanacetum coccineum]
MSSHTFPFSFLCFLTIFTFFHCYLSAENATNIQCIGYKRTALLEFTNDLIDGANRLVSWNSTNEDCCKWYGITCNNQTGLPGPDDMANFDTPEASIQRFRGTLNPSLQNLTSLSITIDLSYNNFSTNSIPSWIASLKSLVSLNLAICEFNGLVPAGLMNMISLATLDLSNNQLTGIGTAANSPTKNICNLVEINLTWNKFDGKSLLEALTSLFECESSKLESLRFASSGLSGRLSSLLSMYLPDNSISGPLPDSLGRLSSLEELDLSNNEINGSLPKSIGQLTKLMNLNIEHNFLSGVVTEGHFANLTSLVTLRAEANMLRLEISADNWDPPFQLKRLSLNRWNVGPKFPVWLQNQKNIFILYLDSIGISDNIPNWFWDTFSGLRYLNISDNNFSSVSVDDFFCSKMDAEQKQVIYMNLGNTNLSGVLPDCWTNWEFLNILNFQNNNLSGEIPKTLANLSSLESLNMRSNKLSQTTTRRSNEFQEFTNHRPR